MDKIRESSMTSKFSFEKDIGVRFNMKLTENTILNMAHKNVETLKKYQNTHLSK